MSALAALECAVIGGVPVAGRLELRTRRHERGPPAPGRNYLGSWATGRRAAGAPSAWSSGACAGTSGKRIASGRKRIEGMDTRNKIDDNKKSKGYYSYFILFIHHVKLFC
jgi:hypothetical protein